MLYARLPMNKVHTMKAIKILLSITWSSSAEGRESFYLPKW